MPAEEVKPLRLIPVFAGNNIGVLKSLGSAQGLFFLLGTFSAGEK